MGFACSRLLFSSLIFHFKAFPIFTPQMPLLPSLLFLAQAAIITAATPVPATALAHHGSHHRATASPTPAPSPEVRITIVNATSIPFLSLNTEGTNLPVAYPVFPQGTCTGNAPLTNPIIDYLVRNGGAIVAERRLQHIRTCGVSAANGGPSHPGFQDMAIKPSVSYLPCGKGGHRSVPLPCGQWNAFEITHSAKYCGSGTTLPPTCSSCSGKQRALHPSTP